MKCDICHSFHPPYPIIFPQHSSYQLMWVFIFLIMHSVRLEIALCAWVWGYQSMGNLTVATPYEKRNPPLSATLYCLSKGGTQRLSTPSTP